MATVTPDQIITGYMRAVHEVRRRVELYARTAWMSAGSWRDGDIDRLVAQIVPRVQAGQVQTAQLTSAYFAALQTARTGERVSPIPVDRELVTGSRGVPAEDVYRRPAAQMYNALSKGASFAEALDQGINRLQQIVSTDHQLAKREQARSSATAGGFKYMIRTLTGLENCAMCAIASTQRYRVQDLQPIHGGCDCGSDTISANADPGQIINPELLEFVHDAVEAKTGAADRGGRLPDYRDLLLVREHGELGPVLTWRKDNFTGPDDLPMVLS